MTSRPIPAAMAARGLKGVVRRAWWSMEAVGGRVDGRAGGRVVCFLRTMGGSLSRPGGSVGAANSDRLCSGASLAKSVWRAAARGEEMGLSEAR